MPAALSPPPHALTQHNTQRRACVRPRARCCRRRSSDSTTCVSSRCKRLEDAGVDRIQVPSYEESLVVCLCVRVGEWVGGCFRAHHCPSMPAKLCRCPGLPPRVPKRSAPPCVEGAETDWSPRRSVRRCSRPRRTRAGSRRTGCLCETDFTPPPPSRRLASRPAGGVAPACPGGARARARHLAPRAARGGTLEAGVR